MITCYSCNRVYHHGVFPLHCSCGKVTDEQQPKYNHWLSLHKYAVEHVDDWDASKAKTWFDQWCESIPEYSCNCKAKWDEMIRSRPPAFGSPQSFFRWAWARHNDVSVTIGKAPISFEEAVAIYT